MRRVVALLVTLLTAWLGLATPGPAWGAQTYTYDVRHHPAATTSTTSERGPPTTTYDHTADPGAHGTSPRPDASTHGRVWTYTATLTYGYDDIAQHLQVDSTTVTTRVRTEDGRGDSPAPRSFGVAAKTVPTISARSVRFTQDSAGSTFKDGRSVVDLADDRAAVRVNPASLPPIRIFERDGDIHSLDNRRLFAGQYAGVDLPYRWATPAEIKQRNQTQIFGGTGITIRGVGWWSIW